LGRQEWDVVFVIALNTIQRRDLHCSNAHTGIFGEVPLEVLLVYGRP
jgi:hypothetical protein